MGVSRFFKKTIFIFFGICLFFGSTINHASAHFAGQAPYFKINNEYTILYHVLLNADPAPGFTLPEDNAPENYLVNQNLSFELDKNFLPISRLDLSKAQFFWDFGDGTQGTGFSQTHTYSKIGSYILTIYIKNALSYISPFPNYPFESVLLNVLPNKNYVLPNAMFSVNGKMIHDPLTEYIWLDFSQNLQFDASKSVPGTGMIVSFLWDFGDQKSATIAHISHRYEKTTGQIYPILRVKDSNGFISDTFIELNNTLYSEGNNPFDKVLKTQRQNSILTISTNVNNFIKRITIDAFNKSGRINYSLLLLIIIFAFFAGSLHALTPGHGKTLMAAFLIGKGKSKIFDVFVLAATMTFTHTIIIYILGIVFLLINIHYPISSLIPYFDKVGAFLVIILAGMLLRKGYKNFIHRRAHLQGHEHTHSVLDKKSNLMNLLLAGISGGLTPCIDALALLILAVTLNQILFGLIVIFIFSLGLAFCIIALGLVLVIGKNKIKVGKGLENFADIYAPFIAGIVILLLALRLLLS